MVVVNHISGIAPVIHGAMDNAKITGVHATPRAVSVGVGKDLATGKTTRRAGGEVKVRWKGSDKDGLPDDGPVGVDGDRVVAWEGIRGHLEGDGGREKREDCGEGG